MNFRNIACAACVILFVAFTSSCFSEIPQQIPLDEPDDSVTVDASGTTPLPYEITRFNLFVTRTNLELRKLEPESGIYLGAYINSDRAIGGTITAFEELMGVSHAIYAHTMDAGSEFPFTWVLELASTMKTPLITIHPAYRFAPFDLHLIEQTARDAGKFNFPLFINLFPVSRYMNYNAVEYVAFFRRAREIFAEHAPNAALIWSVHFEDVFNTEPFYPGNNYVDWVGISAFANISDGQHIDIMRHISHFYFRFQHEHPIIITQLGVSYFTTTNFTFHTRQAAAEIERIYNTVANNFPRIKAIVYASFDNTDFQNGRGLNNFRITGELPLIESYARVTSGHNFLSTIDEHAQGNVTLKSPFQVAEKNNSYFLPKNALVFDLEIDIEPLHVAQIEIGGNYYVPLQLIVQHKNLKYYINREIGAITFFASH